MVQLLIWFQTNYPELKGELLKCHHNFDENETNPYHIEGDCWSHTMMVCKIAELKNYDMVVKVAALLHDIGKPQSRKINPKNNHVQFFGHEELSAQMAKPLVSDLMLREILNRKEAVEVLEIIALHGEIYKQDIALFEKRFEQRHHVFIHLLELSECDDLGRFSPTMRSFNEI